MFSGTVKIIVQNIDPDIKAPGDFDAPVVAVPVGGRRQACGITQDMLTMWPEIARGFKIYNPAPELFFEALCHPCHRKRRGDDVTEPRLYAGIDQLAARALGKANHRCETNLTIAADVNGFGNFTYPVAARCRAKQKKTDRGLSGLLFGLFDCGKMHGPTQSHFQT